jgi:hypothetical protein
MNGEVVGVGDWQGSWGDELSSAAQDRVGVLGEGRQGVGDGPMLLA